jgi:ABC-type branched-subunit amino acid transport system ATPase component
LEAEGIEVAFGGVRANAGISIAVRHAAVTGLIGPNGAGKTTLFNVVSGAIRPDAGRIRLDGDDVTGAAPQDLVGRGCARTFQELALLDDLSVLDNVVFGAQHRWPHRLTPTVLRLRRRSESELVELARRALHLVGLAGEAGRPVSGLPYGLRRRVEIARALAAGPRLLLLDEPSSGMDPVETAELAELVNHIVDRLGVAVFLVEHDMNMVRLTADWLYVLDAGRLLCAGPPAEVLADPRVATAYLGTGR